ncbi:MAG: NADH-quinone oxidoreductase subunit L [Legionellaceae bacterium]
MYDLIHQLSLLIILSPLIGGLLAGFFGKKMGNTLTHSITIIGIGFAFIASCLVAKLMICDKAPIFNRNIYTWILSGNFQFNIGILIDPLSALMLVTVTFVSLLVHIYSIGYMKKDSGYTRFFSYISMFTFAMLTLISSNNFLQLFFGWEGVGLVSYLLIGFWFKKESAADASLKAFLVNRVGDFGFILGIAGIFNYFNSIDYASVFARVPLLMNTQMSIIPGYEWSVITVCCLLLFIGAMGKSAQVPLHVWLPESMEGPTPISALIHAATMVTAGIYLVARLSPLFEYSEMALSIVLIIGATGALFMGILALVQTDIKRIVAYSTLSQLGYMVAALGASAFSAAIFHLITHACFKALLFLAAGSVIIALHHEQDIRKMGNLRRYLPITYITFLIGTLALAAIPPFSGFYSKDTIIEAIHNSQITGASYAYICVLLGSFVTALYAFRGFFLVFHTKERISPALQKDLKEPPSSMWLPLIILAIPSIILGALIIEPLLFSSDNWLARSVFVLPQHNVMAQLVHEYQGIFNVIIDAFFHPAYWFAVSGIIAAIIAYLIKPMFPSWLMTKFNTIYKILINKYGFDEINDLIFVRGGKAIARWLYNVSDVKIIDQLFVNGSGRLIVWFSQVTRRIQSGYLFHYAFIMIFGLITLLFWLILR